MNSGFVSKCLKGANVPTGETQFQFKAAGSRFILTAIDGEMPGGRGLDKIRITIWKDDAAAYDNLTGAKHGGDPTMVIGGGGIAIRKP